MRVNLPVQEICFYTGIIKKFGGSERCATLKAGVADIKADGKVVRQLKDELEGERKDEISSRGKKEELACYYDKKTFSSGMIECSIKLLQLIFQGLRKILTLGNQFSFSFADKNQNASCGARTQVF